MPQAKTPRPGITAIVGHMEESIRLPGATALTFPWTRPYMFFWPGFVAKSSISLFRGSRGPARRARCRRSRSTSSSRRRPSRRRPRRRSASSSACRARGDGGLRRRGSRRIDRRRQFSQSGGIHEEALPATPPKAGSPRYRLRSRNARFSISASQCIAEAPWTRSRPGMSPTASAISASTGPEEGAGVVKTSAPTKRNRSGARTFAS